MSSTCCLRVQMTCGQHADDLQTTYVVRMSSAFESCEISHSDVIRMSSVRGLQQDFTRLQC